MTETAMQKKPIIDVIIVAAGRGERIGTPQAGPKQYRKIANIPIIQLTLSKFRDLNSIRKIVVVHHADDLALLESACSNDFRRITPVTGGATRQASVRQGLMALAGDAPDFVMIHDAVRPFVTTEILHGLINRLMPDHGIILAKPIVDSLAKSDDYGVLKEAVHRENLFAAETPQCFPFAFILDAHNMATEQIEAYTDDASLARAYHLPVKVMENTEENFKITYANDLKRAEALLGGATMMIPDIRTGNGYDVHATMAGSQVTLCGISIPAQITLRGHSDADVGMHALTDALLSTIGAGDIGTHFPPSDDQWKGAASHIFLSHAAKLVREANGTITHCAVTLICETPKIGPHRTAMIAKLAESLHMTPERISITATTNEAIGFVGRGEGIAAIATATVAFPPFDPGGFNT